MTETPDQPVVDIARLRGWIGESAEHHDTVTPRLLAQFCATLDRPVVETPLPPSLHWCLALPAPPLSDLGHDGHEKLGRFLPPVPLPRRMWAGGEVELLAPLRLHDPVTRRSTVSDVTQKTGRSGALVFVTVTHEITSPRGLAVRERQDLVYRAPVDSAAPTAPPEAPEAEHSQSVTADAVMLFRYSAITFNGHRIHYDRDHCADEGYPGLVVHGPLQATLMLEMATRLMGRAPARFGFRGLGPLTGGVPFTVNAREGKDGLDLWTGGPDGRMAMRATAG